MKLITTPSAAVIDIPLAATPNQSLSILLDGHLYDLTVRANSASVTRDGVVVVDNVRLLPGAFLLPYEYQTEGGNFVFTTEGDALPDWQQFGVTQFLTYA